MTSNTDPSRTHVELKLNGEYTYVPVVRWSADGRTVTVTLPSGCEDTFSTDRIVG